MKIKKVQFCKQREKLLIFSAHMAYCGSAEDGAIPERHAGHIKPIGAGIFGRFSGVIEIGPVMDPHTRLDQAFQHDFGFCGDLKVHRLAPD